MVELGFGVTLRELVEDFGGGTASGRPIRAIQVGGPLGSYLTADQPKAALDPVQRQLIDTIERRDGSQQVTYNGWPLYYYRQDARIGDVNGQDVEEVGGQA